MYITVMIAEQILCTNIVYISLHLMNDLCIGRFTVRFFLSVSALAGLQCAFFSRLVHWQVYSALFSLG
jgi:hypothetical protein